MKSNPMGRILSEFKRSTVPKTLTMDRENKTNSNKQGEG